MKSVSLFLFSFLLCLNVAQSQVPVEVDLVSFATGLTRPVDITHAGDDRLFIVEKSGTIAIVRPDGQVDANHYLDITSSVTSGGLNSERGLLGLAFHPDYATNEFFFVHYIMAGGDSRISRFSVTTDPDVADPTSEQVIMTIDQPYNNHNGGCLKFGPDGYLYIGMGDGGSAGDPQGYSQNVNSLLGKMLRIDVDNGLPYTVPSSNPFIGTTTEDEIWSIGLRNPWRFSFDSQNGDMWIGDVGQNTWEEIDYQPASSTGGENYGWRCYEGLEGYNTTNCDPQSTYVDPVAQLSHSDGHCSISGGMVYRGAANVDMQGKYFCVDYCSGQFWSIELDDTNNWVVDEASITFGFGSTAMGADINGEMYVSNQVSGTVSRVVDIDCVGYSVSLDAVDADLTATTGGDVYQWYLDGEVIIGADMETFTATESGLYSVEILSADGCKAWTNEVEVEVDNGCAEDLNGDMVVDVNDFIMFNSAFGSTCVDCPEDIDGDGVVNVNDFLSLNSAFGDICN